MAKQEVNSSLGQSFISWHETVTVDIADILLSAYTHALGECFLGPAGVLGTLIAAFIYIYDYVESLVYDIHAKKKFFFGLIC